jgi:hypothetical protein
MLSISLGPVALPVLPLLVLATLWLAASLAARAARRGLDMPDVGSLTSLPAAAENAVWVAGLLGLAAARLAYVALHGSAYVAAPVSVLDIRDGGWWAPAGWLVGAAWLLRCSWRRPELRRALLRAASVLALLALGLDRRRTRPARRPGPAGRGQRIIELGCGAAALARALVQRFADSHVTGTGSGRTPARQEPGCAADRISFLSGVSQSIPFPMPASTWR